MVRSIDEIKAAIAPKAEPEAVAPQPPADCGRARRQGKLEKRQRQCAARFAAATAVPDDPIGRGGPAAGDDRRCGCCFRTEIVRLVPDMAGVYSALGLGVNVVGLEFSDVSTLMSGAATAM